MKKKYEIRNTKYENKKGITLFIAVVIMGILLLISFAVINITLKATLFASSGRDSQYAFFAADAGIECAIYWDSAFDISKFATSTSGSPINCAGKTISNGGAIPGNSNPILIGGGGSANPTSTFYFTLDQGENSVASCAIVTVTKNTDGSTYIKSRGYNTCDTSNPRRIERGIEID
ncbi:MAG: hypothetical protein UR80_C0037G0004 [Parcubacteria group bacterium GW2011_GWB1_35_5]|uniref:Type 4 fimbrial biogenesis protein PilX N-terminal domain-containing protein n=1 Tax=Candidatus Zambryskibacteria bacterium RIFCSPLOWO2_01_FULL_35_19 TaxID=1802757 RepID=A0A1G2TVK8_9BACT|nr:MAG: hypothetical protein UR50_C0006G0008 [Parcubacteria group bacterium GW2011_GWC1_34_10]KKP80149.1 MAG: hypothetical protein UR80_C0037G0004 [Parcubacteria group bacterium GW2011_GWB1_35_5]OHA86015.1 MAG: hypothetical protein A2726_01270 [Candidatus Zambryskibacteria bacterium RIFCSPHIGHO2_01_FULL_35_32]OHB01189.1 MAG: hypothetical protein A3A90_01555 [Candidatus Zambryskibacteria bacterium RIFCSPLOWO2_01_FULL_35_19]